MYRIRFHGRGGQGIKTAGRLLGTALFRSGFEVQDAPRYGAERRGAPIVATVRAERAPIRERGIIRRPDLVIVADDTLVPVPAAGILAGIEAYTVLLIRSHDAADTWRHRLNLDGPVLVLPPEQSPDRSGLPFVGAVCAGAAARLLGVVTEEVLARAIREEQGHLGGAIVARNLDLALGAYAAMDAHAGCVSEGPEVRADAYEPPQWVELPAEAAGVSAPVIHAALTSEAQHTGLWRTLRPVIDYERCKHCWWVCSGFCPDGAIRVEEGVPEIDYDHCKGCLVCVVQCPPHAIEAVPEYAAKEAS
jgi:pyruvate ferredoxin oxidoreductase gamma subunit